MEWTTGLSSFVRLGAGGCRVIWELRVEAGTSGVVVEVAPFGSNMCGLGCSGGDNGFYGRVVKVPRKIAGCLRPGVVLVAHRNICGRVSTSQETAR